MKRKHYNKKVNKRTDFPKSITTVILRLAKIGGSIEYKTLRRSKQRVHPRKILINIKVPIAAQYDKLLSTPVIKELKSRTIYKGCVTSIKQTSPKFCLVTFSFILKSVDQVEFFTRLLCNLAFSTKNEIETLLNT